MVNKIPKNIALIMLLALSVVMTGCTSNDLDMYRDNGLIPGEDSTIAEVVQKAEVAAKKRDEESIGNALDELAEFLIATSSIWLPIFLSSSNN